MRTGEPEAVLRRVLLLFGSLALALVLAPAARATAPELTISGMTFVSSRDNENEVVLRARRAVYDSEVDRLALEDVEARVTTSDDDFAFSVSCDTGELDLDSNDFEARGNVTGRTDSGQEFTTQWVRYDHREGVLFTDTEVVISEGSGTYRGGGFRYLVRKRRFKLLGGASVVHTP